MVIRFLLDVVTAVFTLLVTLLVLVVVDWILRLVVSAFISLLHNVTRTRSKATAVGCVLCGARTGHSLSFCSDECRIEWAKQQEEQEAMEALLVEANRVLEMSRREG